MKQFAVSKIPYGKTFRVFGDTFVALDRVDGGVLAIRCDIWKNAPFDKDGRNDMRRASIRNDLSDYLIELFGNGTDKESIAKTDVDLKATDGTREYGFFRMWAALLTLEQYGRYQHSTLSRTRRKSGGWQRLIRHQHRKKVTQFLFGAPAEKVLVLRIAVITAASAPCLCSRRPCWLSTMTTGKNRTVQTEKEPFMRRTWTMFSAGLMKMMNRKSANRP